MTRRNQKDRIYHTVTARNGVRLVLPSGTDPIGWYLKQFYAALSERTMVLTTPLLKHMARKPGAKVRFVYWNVVNDRAGVAK